MKWLYRTGDRVSISSLSRWPDGTNLYIEGVVVEVRANGDVFVVEDDQGARHYAKGRLLAFCEETS